MAMVTTTVVTTRPAPRGFGRRVLHQAMQNIGARLGLAWISFLALIAIFAPWIANSHPLLVHEDGRTWSPLLHHLTASDVTLLVAFFALLGVWRGKWTWPRKITVVCAITAVTLGFNLAFLHPPELTVYEQYREKEAQGAYQWIVRAPIPYSPNDYLRDLARPGLEAPLADIQYVHLFGTEENGADVLSRMIHASRIALAIGLIATGIAMAIGIVLGGLMGYFSGKADLIGMRLVEIFEAIPTLFLLLTFVAFFGRSLYMMMVIIGVTGWTGYARFLRAEFLRLRQQDFVQAAVACGLPLKSVLFRHILPNAIAPVLVAASFGIAAAILSEATLSFLGLGLVDAPSWGQMLNQAVKSSTFNWWMAAFPGGAIFFTVFAYNLLGESLRDALDPHLKKTSK